MKINLSSILLNGFTETYRNANSRSLCGEGVNAKGLHVLRTFTLSGENIIEAEIPRHSECAFRKVSTTSLSELLDAVPDGSELVVDF